MNSFEDIWNSENYENLRKMHISGKFPEDHKFKKDCDLKKIYNYSK